MRFFAVLLAAVSTASLAQSPPSIVTQPSKLDATWQAKTRALYETAVEIPTVSGRNQVPKLAEFLAGELKAAGFAADDIKIMPYEGETGDKTAALKASGAAAVVSADCGCLLNINGAFDKQHEALRGEHLASFLLRRCGGEDKGGKR